jgi:hypothetical protein
MCDLEKLIGLKIQISVRYIYYNFIFLKKREYLCMVGAAHRKAWKYIHHRIFNMSNMSNMSSTFRGMKGKDKFYFIYLFFCGFELRALYHLNHTSSPFCSGYFGDRVS